MWIQCKEERITHMNILAQTMVSNSEMIKNYKTCREKAEDFGKIFIIKNNKPDAVLFSIAEYKKILGVIEYLDSLDEQEVVGVIDILTNTRKEKKYTVDTEEVG
jgi:PHD/YefM family antitoxin component YafN of YafNO toxin-antitoxin module